MSYKPVEFQNPGNSENIHYELLLWQAFKYEKLNVTLSTRVRTFFSWVMTYMKLEWFSILTVCRLWSWSLGSPQTLVRTVLETIYFLRCLYIKSQIQSVSQHFNHSLDNLNWSCCITTQSCLSLSLEEWPRYSVHQPIRILIYITECRDYTQFQLIAY